MKAYELIADALAHEGADVVFALLGDGNMLALSAYGRHCAWCGGSLLGWVMGVTLRVLEEFATCCETCSGFRVS